MKNSKKQHYNTVCQFMLSRFIEQMTQEFLWEPVTTRQDGSYLLVFEPQLQISLSEKADFGITFSSLLTSLPKENQHGFFLRVMQANLFGKETGNGILGIDKEGKNLLFLSFLLGEVSYKNFRVAFEDFINYAESWKEEALGWGK